jgi:hypothetical protein
MHIAHTCEKISFISYASLVGIPSSKCAAAGFSRPSQSDKIRVRLGFLGSTL